MWNNASHRPLWGPYTLYTTHIYKITENKVVNPTTTPSPVAPQVVTTTTHGATNDDEVVKPTSPCPQRSNMQYKILTQQEWSVKSNSLNK